MSALAALRSPLFRLSRRLATIRMPVKVGALAGERVTENDVVKGTKKDEGGKAGEQEAESVCPGSNHIDTAGREVPCDERNRQHNERVLQILNSPEAKVARERDHESLLRSAGEYLADIEELVRAIGVRLDGMSNGTAETWHERRRVAKARKPYVTYAVRVACRAIELARWASDITPEDPNWTAVVREISELNEHFGHGRASDTNKWLAILTEVDRQAPLALEFRYLRAVARIAVGNATRGDKSLVKRADEVMRDRALEVFGRIDAPPGVAEEYLTSTSQEENEPEQRIADVVVYRMKTELPDFAQRLHKSSPLLAKLIREWPERGGPSESKWQTASDLFGEIGLCRVGAQQVRKYWFALKRERRERSDLRR